MTAVCRDIYLFFVEIAALAWLYNPSHWHSMACLVHSASFVCNSHAHSTG